MNGTGASLVVTLKRGREKSVRARHHWIFSGAVARVEGEASPGAIAAVRDSAGAVLGYGCYGGRASIAVRMLTFGDRPFTTDVLRGLIRAAIARRRDTPLLAGTDAVRLVFSEGDALPGLIVDSYNGHLVLQSLTAGIDHLRNDIAGILVDELAPASLYERSDHAGRALEGLSEASGQLVGSTPDAVEIHEGGVAFVVDITRGQKTGFFLDQRDTRALVRSVAAGRRALDLFCYQGGFSLAALAGGARSCVAVDASEAACAAARRNIAHNAFDAPAELVCADVFEFIRARAIDADLVIIDPPAFAKSREAVARAARGYKDINLNVLRACPPGSLVLTCSCSRFVDAALFQKIVFGAAADANRAVSILRRTHQPADHPVNIYHPETEYLTALLLSVE